MKLLWLYFFSSFGLVGYLIAKNYSIDHPTSSLAFTRLLAPKTNQMILLNGFVAGLLTFVTMNIKIYFGELREIERFDVIDKIKHKILSFAFILIILTDEILTSQLIAIFLLLLILSIFHWLALKRSEFLIVENQGNYRGHLKMTLFFFQLIGIDIFLLANFYDTLFVSHTSLRRIESHMIALLTFEVLILFLRSCSQIFKYFLNLIEIATYSTFESKQTIASFAEFIFSLLALASELYLFIYMYRAFGAPLHLILETLETVISIFRIVAQMYNSIVLVNKLSRLPDVTHDDIVNIDNTCLICLNEIKHGKKISCGHIFHYGCLKSWIQGNVNQFCPKCKKPIKIDDKAIAPAGIPNLPIPEAILAQNILNSNEDESVKVEKMNDLAFNIENESIVRLYQIIKLEYEKDENMGLSHQETIKKIFEDILTKNLLFKSKIGAVEYGLPREAVPFKSKELLKLRKRIKLINMISFGKTKHEFIGFSNKISNIQAENVNLEEPIPKPTSIRTSPTKSIAEETKMNRSSTKPNQADEIIKPKETIIPLSDENDLEKIEQEDDDHIRRRQAILEALEKRNSSI